MDTLREIENIVEEMNKDAQEGKEKKIDESLRDTARMVDGRFDSLRDEYSKLKEKAGRLGISVRQLSISDEIRKL